MLTNTSERARRTISVAATAIVVLVLGACSADGGKTGAAGADGSSTSDEVLAEARSNVETWYANTSAAVETKGLHENNLRGKRLFYLSGYLASPSGTLGLQGLKEAQAALGFDLTVFDGEFSPDKYQEGLRQVLAGNYDGAILYGVDCPGNEEPLGKLSDAGIPVIAMSGADCDTADPAAESQFTAEVEYPLGEGRTGNSVELFEAWGASQADYVIAMSGGRAKVILFELPDFYVTKALAQGFRDRIAVCGGCEVVEEVQVMSAEIGGPAVAQKTDQALLKHPEATAVVGGYDDFIVSGLSNSVAQSGRAEDLLVVGGSGFEAALDLLRAGKGYNAGWGFDYVWDHYAAVATMINTLAGQPTGAVGNPVVWYDEDHNLPSEGVWKPEFDFKAAFQAAWDGR